MVPFYVGMIVPFILIYIFNWVLFTVIIVSLTRKTCVKREAKQQKKDGNAGFVRQQLVIVATLSILFGLGWGIGLLATQEIHSNDVVRDLFAALFVIVTGFHGLFIFIMHCLRSSDVRREWNRWFHGVTGKDFTEFTSTSGTLPRGYRAGQTVSTTGALTRTGDKKSRQFSGDLSSPRQSDTFTFDSDTLKRSSRKEPADVELAVFSPLPSMSEEERKKEKEREIEEMEKENETAQVLEGEPDEVEKAARKILEEQEKEMEKAQSLEEGECETKALEEQKIEETATNP